MEKPFYAYKKSVLEEGYTVTGNIEETYDRYLSAVVDAEDLDGAIAALSAKYPYAGRFHA